MRPVVTALLVVAVGAGYFAVSHVYGGQTAPRGVLTRGAIGSDAPAFRLPVISGSTDKEVSLASLRGRRAFLEFWASWCEACRAERPMLAKLRERNPQATMIAIASMDTAPDVRKSEAAQPHGYPVALDSDGALAQDFAIAGLPHSLVLDADGKILRSYAGKLNDADVEEITQLLH